MPKPNAMILLLDEVDALCQVYVGKNAASEAWIDTARRIERLDKLRRSARRYVERQKEKV